MLLLCSMCLHLSITIHSHMDSYVSIADGDVVLHRCTSFRHDAWYLQVNVMSDDVGSKFYVFSYRKGDDFTICCRYFERAIGCHVVSSRFISGITSRSVHNVPTLVIGCGSRALEIAPLLIDDCLGRSRPRPYGVTFSSRRIDK